MGTKLLVSDSRHSADPEPPQFVAANAQKFLRPLTEKNYTLKIVELLTDISEKS